MTATTNYMAKRPLGLELYFKEFKTSIWAPIVEMAMDIFAVIPLSQIIVSTSEVGRQTSPQLLTPVSLSTSATVIACVERSFLERYIASAHLAFCYARAKKKNNARGPAHQMA